jgi:hypothetical protein
VPAAPGQMGQISNFVGMRGPSVKVQHNASAGPVRWLEGSQLDLNIAEIGGLAAVPSGYRLQLAGAARLSGAPANRGAAAITWIMARRDRRVRNAIFSPRVAKRFR